MRIQSVRPVVYELAIGDDDATSLYRAIRNLFDATTVDGDAIYRVTDRDHEFLVLNHDWVRKVWTEFRQVYMHVAATDEATAKRRAEKTLAEIPATA